MNTRKSRIQVELIYVNGVLRKVMSNSKPPNIHVKLLDLDEAAYAEHAMRSKYHATKVTVATRIVEHKYE